MFDYFLFDLDGTISDSFDGISKSIVYALGELGEPIPSDLHELDCFIGPPLLDQFMESYGFDKARAELAVAKFRERYSAVGWRECSLMPGTTELLSQLKAGGKKIALATSKRSDFAERVLDLFNITGYFDFIGGAGMTSRRTKTEVLEYVLENLKPELSSTVLVGDRKYDVEGARNVGIRSIGVPNEFGTREELEQAGADFIAENLLDVARIVNICNT